MIFPQNSKLAYNFESLSLKPLHGSRVVHYIVLAPTIVVVTPSAKALHLP